MSAEAGSNNHPKLNTKPVTGGCQCGAIRYRAQRIYDASLCHCRMCQKATGSLFAPLVNAEGFEWTRGERGIFASSNLSDRGFCRDCGTPISLETDGHIELMIGTLDDPSLAPPARQANPNDRLPVFKHLSTLPNSSDKQSADNEIWNALIVSNQHPDHETST